MAAGRAAPRVREWLAALTARGTGASVQREVYRRSGSLSAVVAQAVAHTLGGP